MTTKKTLPKSTLDIILNEETDNLPEQLSDIGWKPNTSYKVERLPVSSYWNDTYNLSGIAIACKLPNVLRFAMDCGETCCAGSSNSSNKIAYLQALSKSEIPLDEDVLIDAIIPSLKMGFSDDKDISEISRKAILNGFDRFLSELREYVGRLSININDFVANRNAHQTCSKLLEMYTSGAIKSIDFYPFIEEIARKWINLELDESYELPLSKTMIETILCDYLGAEVSIQKALSISNSKLSLNSCLVLCQKGLMSCIDISGYALSDCGDDDIVNIMPYYARQLKTDDIIGILRKRESEESIFAILENRLKMQNHYSLISAIYKLIIEGNPVASKIIDVILSNPSLNQLRINISNWKSYANLTIPADNKKSYAENDWIKIAKICNAKEIGILHSSLSIKEKIAFIFSPSNMSASYILLKGLIDVKGIDNVAPYITRKEQQEVLLAMHTPMEVMPYLPVRAQQKILKDLSSGL